MLVNDLWAWGDDVQNHRIIVKVVVVESVNDQNIRLNKLQLINKKSTQIILNKPTSSLFSYLKFRSFDYVVIVIDGLSKT